MRLKLKTINQTRKLRGAERDHAGWKRKRVEEMDKRRREEAGESEKKRRQEYDASEKRRERERVKAGDKWNTNICIGRRRRPRNILECRL